MCKLAKCNNILHEIQLFILQANSACNFASELADMQLSRDMEFYVKPESCLFNCTISLMTDKLFPND